MYSMLVTLGVLQALRIKRRSLDKKPIVFVPGLFGSMSNEIMPGTGSWKFGMAGAIYEPFIKTLESLGYIRQKNLFVAYYDWRKDCNTAAERYLKKTIVQAKKTTGSKQVDVICHSMGGLVARAYAQSEEYEKDIDNLIMIATPNAGAVNAYYFWAGGEPPYSGDLKSNLLRTLMEGYLWMLKKYYGMENDIETIHKHILGARDLLPGEKYGHYLYQLGSGNRMKFIPYSSLRNQNHFIDKLNQRKELLSQRGIQTTLIGAKGIETNQYLQVDKNIQDDTGRWGDGKVIDAYSSGEGDGTVMLKSALAIHGDTYIFEENHTDILKKCEYVIKRKLGIVETTKTVEQEQLHKGHISILIEGNGEVAVKHAVDRAVYTIYSEKEKRVGVYQQSFGPRLQWILIANPVDTSHHLDFHAKTNDILNMHIHQSSGQSYKIEGKEVIEGKNYRIPIQ
ncbi:MAG: hypothetical protein AB2421_05500 [Thermotaleaceae bacterium]